MPIKRRSATTKGRGLQPARKSPAGRRPAVRAAGQAGRAKMAPAAGRAARAAGRARMAPATGRAAKAAGRARKAPAVGRRRPATRRPKR